MYEKYFRDISFGHQISALIKCVMYNYEISNYSH